MTKDLLEEMEDDMEDETPEIVREPRGSSERKSFGKRLLGSKKRLLLILVVGLVLVGTLGGIWFFLLRGTSEEASLAGENSAAEQGVRGEDGADRSDIVDEIVFEDIVVLEPFERISLKTDSAMGLISVNISLELIDHRYRKQVYSVQDRIRTIIMGQIREMKWLELRNPAGKIQLKYELLKGINSIFPKAMVRNVYFTNLIMQ